MDGKLMYADLEDETGKLSYILLFHLSIERKVR